MTPWIKNRHYLYLDLFICKYFVSLARGSLYNYSSTRFRFTKLLGALNKFLSTKYTSLAANLPSKSFSVTAPCILIRYKETLMPMILNINKKSMQIWSFFIGWYGSKLLEGQKKYT